MSLSVDSNECHGQRNLGAETWKGIGTWSGPDCGQNWWREVDAAIDGRLFSRERTEVSIKSDLGGSTFGMFPQVLLYEYVGNCLFTPKGKSDKFAKKSNMPMQSGLHFRHSKTQRA